MWLHLQPIWDFPTHSKAPASSQAAEIWGRLPGRAEHHHCCVLFHKMSAWSPSLCKGQVCRVPTRLGWTPGTIHCLVTWTPASFPVTPLSRNTVYLLELGTWDKKRAGLSVPSAYTHTVPVCRIQKNDEAVFCYQVNPPLGVKICCFWT